MSAGRVSVKCRPSGEVSEGVGRHACRPTVGRYIDRVSADISAEYRSTYRPTVGRHIGRLSVDISAESIDRHSVDRCLKYT